MVKSDEKVVFLFPHLPNPRMLKRIDALKKDFNVEVIYWDRLLAYTNPNELSKDVKKHVITVKGNEGRPLSRLKNTLKVMVEALKIIKKIKPKILYLSKTDMLLVGVVYKRLFNKEAELIYEVSDLHSLQIDKQKGILKKIMSWTIVKLEKSLCQNIKLLVVTSENFYEQFYKNFIEKSKMMFIPNTPEPEVFQEFKRNYNKRYTIGFIGAVRYAKQIEMLIDAAELTETNIFIAGKGVDSQRIEEYAKGKDYVKIYGEYQYEKEIKTLYEQVDCIYSVYDASKRNVQIALPNRLYEAIYTNTPIIAAKTTYLGELVEKYGIGKTTHHENTSELVKVIEELKSSDKILYEIKQNLAIMRDKWVLEKYNEKLINKIKS